MKKLRWSIMGSLLLLAGIHGVNAEDYLLDASKMTVGTTVSENLVVKEGCIDSREPTCGTGGKAKYLTGSAQIKAGNLEILGTLTGDFEFSFVVASNGPKGDIIQFLTSEDKGIKIDNYGGLYTNGVGKDGGANFNYYKVGWESSIFNQVVVTVKQGVARAYTNGQEFRYPITGLEGVVFNRVIISGIETTDRIAEIKVRGLKELCPVTNNNVSPSDPSTILSGDCTASYDSVSGRVIIPCIAVPVASPFGGTQIQNYRVEMQQRAGSFIFDLDVNKITAR